MLGFVSQLFSPPSSRGTMASVPLLSQPSVYPPLPSPPRTPSPAMPGSFQFYRDVDELDSPPPPVRSSQNVPVALLSPESSRRASGVELPQGTDPLLREASAHTPHLSQRTTQLTLESDRVAVQTRLFASTSASPSNAGDGGSAAESASPTKSKRAFNAIHEDEEPSARKTPSVRPSQRPRLSSPIVPPNYMRHLPKSSQTTPPFPHDPFAIQIHNHFLHNMLKDFPWSFRYAFCCFVSNGWMDWNDVDTTKLSELLGTMHRNPIAIATNAGLGALAADFLPKEKRSQRVISKRVLDALDDEERSLKDRRDSHKFGKIEWPAGHVKFSALLQRQGSSKESSELKLVLQPPSLSVNNSNRFVRKLGSRAVLSVSIEDTLLRQDDLSYLYDAIAQGLLIEGEVFHAICAKDGSITFISGMTAPYLGLGSITSDDFWIWFVRWHNDWKRQPDQSMTKWGARMQLGLSDSVPGPTLKREGILTKPDIISPFWDGEGKPPSEMIMTDGSGYMSQDIRLHIQHLYDLRHPPAAVQVRVAGAKGLLVACPLTHITDHLQIWIRPSQVKSYPKIAYLDDPSLTTIDVLRPSDWSMPSRITAQLIINLRENYVPASVLCNAFTAALEAATEPFMKYATENDRLQLCKVIETECRIVTSRLSRSESSLRGRFIATRQNDTTIPDFPPTKEEAAYCSLMAGFSHASNPHVYKDVKFILKSIIKQYIGDFRFPLDQSLDALIIPDPLGVLEEGEIAFYFPDPIQEPSGAMVDCLRGDVLVYRHPGLLPTDAQKVKAVDRGVLRMWTGVIIMSTCGRRSPASYLSGGDYDGDRAIIIWDEKIVTPFRNADIRHASPSSAFEESIQNVNESAHEVDSKMSFLAAKSQRQTLQSFLLAGMKNDYVMQRYSHLHDVAVAAYGLHDPRSIDLAHKYNLALDSPKSGLRIKKEVFRQDVRKFDRAHPWKMDKLLGDNRLPLKREAPGAFILYQLAAQGKELQGRLLKRFHDLWLPVQTRAPWKDAALSEPWEKFQQRASCSPDQNMVASRTAIAEHVNNVLLAYDVARRSMGSHYQAQQMGALDSSSPKSDYGAQLCDIRRQFWDGADACNVGDCISSRELRAVLASCAHVIAENKTSFAFDVAFWDIIRLKADSVRLYVQPGHAEPLAGRMAPAPTVSSVAMGMLTLNKRLLGTSIPQIGRARTT
ncbi:hypothetical protein CALCODRAFT_76601 [Calocera cornea HHB12733]|uniref:RNA-dependent RNA polymerase n=1 Tax=Calocera cornea HHB12733 TaxID=1353952 RepID=A0A165DHZ2_9BASI|nr:hypothetical protein CALCODRAFT_76601 [Calocera cornea HHB12733]